MSKMSKKAKRPAPGLAPDLMLGLPASLAVAQRGNIAIVTLKRPHKRNALDDITVLGLQSFFVALPKEIKAVVLNGEGEHFSAGLDPSQLTQSNTAEGVEHSASRHRA